MKIERTFGEYFSYSLHDARVQKIEYIDENLILYFDYIFSYDKDGEENTHKAKIVFESVDIDDVKFLVFDDIIREDFKGKSLDLETYIQKYKDSEFEIITETYNYGRAVLQGWLKSNDKNGDCILNIGYFKKMIYEIED